MLSNSRERIAGDAGHAVCVCAKRAPVSKQETQRTQKVCRRTRGRSQTGVAGSKPATHAHALAPHRRASACPALCGGGTFFLVILNSFRGDIRPQRLKHTPPRRNLKANHWRTCPFARTGAPATRNGKGGVAPTTTGRKPGKQMHRHRRRRRAQDMGERRKPRH